MGKIRVLVVDDSIYVVKAVSRRLAAEPGIEVIDTASNGVQAIEKVKALKPDVVTLDVVMPEMDGLTALKYIMMECPTPIVMLSALTSDNAEPTIRALEYGAVDFFLKPSSLKPYGVNDEDNTLVAKIKMAAKQDVSGKGTPMPRSSIKKKSSPQEHEDFKKLVIIGTSTGGPRALMQLVPSLPKNISAGILIVQHMPPMFTKSLAERLDLASEIHVAEAGEGDEIQRGVALMAPGDFHMVVNDKGQINPTQDPPVLGVRPAVNVTMKSVADVYKDNTLGIVLTGMGMDGTEGSMYIKAAGGTVLAQDEATCAVFGMPASVINAGRADKVVPLNKMAMEIIRSCN
jgi:two-component system, chemotaxis family, protein-glutamate methylesterase/glutaminase